MAWIPFQIFMISLPVWWSDDTLCLQNQLSTTEMINDQWFLLLDCSIFPRPLRCFQHCFWHRWNENDQQQSFFMWHTRTCTAWTTAVVALFYRPASVLLEPYNFTEPERQSNQRSLLLPQKKNNIIISLISFLFSMSLFDQYSNMLIISWW